VKFLQSNIRYPAFDLEAGVQGITYVEFTVKSDSSIADVKTLKPVAGSKGMSMEVERVIKLMPKWIPAKQNGKAVDQKCVMSVRFVIL
jgi:protein TonB